MAVLGDVFDVNEIISSGDFEVEDLATERIQKKHERAQRRKKSMYAKNRLRCMAVNDPKTFFSKSKAEQRKEVHLSPYSLKRLRFNHGDAVWGHLVRAERLDKVVKAEMVQIKKEYIGICYHQSDEKLVPTHIELLAEELAEVCGKTADAFLNNPESFVFYTEIYKPDKFDDVCKFVYGEKNVA